MTFCLFSVYKNQMQGNAKTNRFTREKKTPTSDDEVIKRNTLLAILISDKKKCPKIQPSEIFERPKYLQYSIRLLSSSKHLV